MDRLEPPDFNKITFSGRFHPWPPFDAARRHAARAGADLAVLNGPGLGDIIVFTRLVEDFALSVGRPITLLTAPMRLSYGVHSRDGAYPVWENNPFVGHIVNSDELDRSIMSELAIEKDNHFQTAHVIFNIGFNYNVLPTTLRPSLFLSLTEMRNALNTLKDIPRPIVCLHASGSTSTPVGNPWYHDRWVQMIDRLSDRFGFIQVGRRDFRFTTLPVPFHDTTVREAFALIWASDYFVGFDSGLAHTATAFRKPSIVLWDAVHKSSIEERKESGFGLATIPRWAYPFNDNIVLLGEKRGEAVDAISEILLEHQRRRTRRVYSTESISD